MKVLHVIRGLANSSGTTHIVGPLAEQQAGRGCEVSVYCVEKGSDPPVLPDPALVESRCFRLTLPMDSPGVSKGISVALTRGARDFDVIHVHAIWNFPSWWAMRSAYRAGVPYIVAPQGSMDPWALRQNARGKKLYGGFTEIPLLRRANRLQALTGKEAEQFRRFGIHARPEIIPNGISGRLLQREWKPEPRYFGLPENCRTLLFLSRVHPKKGLDLLVDMAMAVRDQLPDLRIVVAGGDAGSGYLKELRERCAGLGLGDVFEFLGEVRGEVKQQCLAAADAFILPSYSEGLPVAVLEALGAGLPVIATDQCNLPEIEEHNAGFVVPPDASAIVSAVTRLFSLSDGRRREMGENARKLAAEKFTWERIAEKTLDCYRAMIEERKPS